MATDIKVVKTVFVVDTADVKKATQDYNNLANSIDKTGKELTETGKQATEGSKKVKDGIENSKQSVDKFKGSFDGIGAAISGAFAIGSIVAFGKTVIDITSQVQKYRAVLTNTLGSQNLADIAMAQISDVAIKTNFSVMELTDTYIKFANRGLKLSQSEMMKLADIANSTGKSIDQLTEATLDAFTGENERLKEFGITAKKTGETTQYTFKGVTTEVKNTQEAIKGYLLSLGDLEGVTGSTAAISETLGGHISNLGDKWDKFLISLGSGNSGIFNTTIGYLNSMLDVINKIVKSNEQLVDEVAFEKSKNIQKEVTAQYEQSLKVYEKTNKSKQEILKQEYEDETKTRNLILEGQKEDLKAMESRQLSKSFQHTQRYKDLENDIIIQKATIKYTQTFLDELKVQYDEYSKQATKKKEQESEKDKKKRESDQKAQLALNKKIVDDALNLLRHEEQIAKQKAVNAGENETDILRIEDDFNYKRVEIYTKYYNILNTKQKQDQENTIVNIDTLGIKIAESDKKILEARKKANEEWSKATNDQHLKDEENLRKTLDRQNSIEQDKIGIQRAQTLIKLYESNNLTVEEKLKEREKIEAEFNKQSLEETIRADEEKLALLTLNSDDYIALERKIADEKVKINDDANNKILESDKKKDSLRKEIAQQAVDVFKQGINAIFQYQANVNTATLIDLQDKEERELKLAEGNQAKKEAIAKKYATEESKIKRKQFEQDKAIALINIAISTAEGVAKAFAKTGPGGFALGALIIASGAIQAGLVASQPTPKFAKGVIDLQGKGTGTSDEIHAMLSKGESVMTAEETTKFKPLLQSIRRKELSPELANMMLSGQRISNVNLNTDSLAKELRGMPKNHISLDKEGFKTYLYSENLKQESLNNRYLS